MLFNEPKLLKCGYYWANNYEVQGFSALQRAEIAEILTENKRQQLHCGFSALQRAEIAEMVCNTVAAHTF